MSKGLGKLQRDILARLDRPGTEVEAGVYDLRRVARNVAKPGVSAQYGGLMDDMFAVPFYPTASYSAAFSRAVQALIRRGELEEVDHLPLGYYGNGSLRRQTRFVRRRSKTP